MRSPTTDKGMRNVISSRALQVLVVGDNKLRQRFGRAHNVLLLVTAQVKHTLSQDLRSRQGLAKEAEARPRTWFG